MEGKWKSFPSKIAKFVLLRVPFLGEMPHNIGMTGQTPAESLLLSEFFGFAQKFRRLTPGFQQYHILRPRRCKYANI